MSEDELFDRLLRIKINEAVSKLEISDIPTYTLILSNVKEHGDYSANIALVLSKILKQSPISIAEKLVSLLGDIKSIEKVEIAPPGFINFFIKQESLAEFVLESIIKNKFVPKDELKKIKVIVEHTSVNPNKAMHIGHIRNAILGDSIARLCRSCGYTVEVHNYIDDTGVQVADTTAAILNLNLPQPADQQFDDYCWDIYALINRKYETEPELIEKRKEILQQIEEGTGKLADTVKDTVNKIVQCHINLMAKFNINYDLLVYESDIIKFGFWDTAFEQLKGSPNFVLQKEGKQAGCWVLKYNDSSIEDKVFVRADGTKVYTAKDTAYHMWKFGLLTKDFLYQQLNYDFLNNELWKTNTEGLQKDNFGHGDVIVNLIDERQTYPQEMVKHALNSLGFKKAYANYNHIAYGVVNLSPETARELGIDTSDKKQSYAMSGRKGIGVKVSDFLDLLIKKVSKEKENNYSNDLKIAVGALKHYMLKYNPNSEITFDNNHALQTTGNTGPYLQYSYTRAANILNKAGEIDFSFVKNQPLTPNEFELIKLLSTWYSVKSQAVETFLISVIAEYAYTLSSAFHSFYENNHVLTAEDEVRSFRLAIVMAYKQIISEVLEIMGIDTLEKM